MKNTHFYKPATLAEALDLLENNRGKAVVVNGGTDIVHKISKKIIDPEVIVYIHDIKELKDIKEDSDYIVIGGAATYADVGLSPLCRMFPGLIQAVREIGSPSIRQMGTPAGNIGSAVPAGDFNVILLALDATVVLVSKNLQRELAIRDVFTGPRQTVIGNNEIIKEIRIQAPKPGDSSCFLKLARRRTIDISQVSVAVYLSAKGSVCEDIRIALGAINPVPVRSCSLEKSMAGKKIEKGLAEIRGVFPTEVSPRDDRFKNYKEMVTSTMIERAIYMAYKFSTGGKWNG